jgi:hypothetical protein
MKQILFCVVFISSSGQAMLCILADQIVYHPVRKANSHET